MNEHETELDPREELEARMAEALSGAADPARRAELDALLAADPQARARFEALNDTWRRMQAAEEAMPKLTSESKLNRRVMQAVRDELGAPAAREVAPPAAAGRLIVWLPLLAAAAMVLVGLAVIYARTPAPEVRHTQETPPPVETPPDGRQVVTPPQPVEVKLDAQPPEWVNEIRKNMRRKVDFEFVDTPLSEAVGFLQSLTKTTIVIDPALANAAAVTLKVTDMRIDLALEWIAKLSEGETELRDGAYYLYAKPAGQSPPQTAQLVLESPRETMAQLDRSVSFEFVEAPFDEALEFLRTLANTNITVDPRIAPRVARKSITLRASGMRLDFALNWITRFSACAWQVKDGAIYISDKFPPRPLKLPAQASEADRLAALVQWTAGPVPRRTILELLARDAGLPLVFDTLSAPSGFESVDLPVGVIGVGFILDSAVKHARPPLLIERTSAGQMHIRPLTADERLDAPHALELPVVEEEAEGWPSVPAREKVADLAWEAGFDLKWGPNAGEADVVVRLHGLTRRQALDALCKAMSWAWSVDGDILHVGPRDLPSPLAPVKPPAPPPENKF
ncbi:MAG: hypothetical protein HS116_03765 [Planctomycetes bacterium]|nr:hypothetical protein [Planctomycetota bacterium]